MDVAVAALPVREPVARDRLHLHVDGQQVVAGVAAVRERVLEEEVRVEALAHEAPVVVGEDDEDGVDLAVRHARSRASRA